VTPEGLPEGEITLKARNWREMIAVAQAAGALPDSLASTVENSLGLLARMSGNRNTLDITLNFSGGRVRLGADPAGARAGAAAALEHVAQKWEPVLSY